MTFRSRLIRLAHEKPELRPHLLPILKEARFIPERLRAKYINLGDFGGTHRILDSWVLEVAGPTIEVKDELKALGLRWDRDQKMWGLWAQEFAYPPSTTQDARRQGYKSYGEVRAAQKRAWPKVQKIVKDHNKKIDEQLESQKEHLKTQKDLVKWLQRNKRMTDRIKDYGIEISYKWPGSYEMDEPLVVVKGQTFDVKDLMKKYGFRWNSREKGWMISTDDFSVLRDKWMGDLIRSLVE